eukprot:2529734-Pleurochrysis_carterae.AAC.3
MHRPEARMIVYEKEQILEAGVLSANEWPRDVSVNESPSALHIRRNARERVREAGASAVMAGRFHNGVAPAWSQTGMHASRGILWWHDAYVVVSTGNA